MSVVIILDQRPSSPTHVEMVQVSEVRRNLKKAKTTRIHTKYERLLCIWGMPSYLVQLEDVMKRDAWRRWERCRICELPSLNLSWIQQELSSDWRGWSREWGVQMFTPNDLPGTCGREELRARTFMIIPMRGLKWGRGKGKPCGAEGREWSDSKLTKQKL